ncbi:DUF1559 domain-containing protein [Singulisphaera sp. Ch08]|uniref:DUF1559 family PulG-like putative transporter n=1 Tax=Singulisphaera sp. Ch08 TaxID=3120278 RepID=UPI0038732137
MLYSGRPRSACGLTLIEVIIVVSIIGVLFALLLPAVQWTREAARRSQCQNNLKQIGLAIHAYASVFNMFPAGRGPSQQSAHTALLPWLDQTPLFNSFNWDLQISGKVANRTSRRTRILGFLCPSDAATNGSEHFPPTSYAANLGDAFSGRSSTPSNGLFLSVGNDWSDLARSRHVGLEGVHDGMSQTSAFSEWLIGSAQLRDPRRSVYGRATGSSLPAWDRELFATRCRSLDGMKFLAGSDIDKGSDWAIGEWLSTLYDHFLPPNAPSCINSRNSSDLYGAGTAASDHSGGVHSTFADGHVQFIRETVDISVWRALGTRDRGEVISSSDY